MNDHLEYTPKEISRNRNWNRVLTIACIGGIWVGRSQGVLSTSGAIAATVTILVFAVLYRILFASPSSVKMDENSAGRGKRVRPGTMGAILGFLYDGFRR